MNFLNSAKKTIIDISSNLTGNNDGLDPQLDMTKSQLQELTALVASLRCDLHAYASSMMAMTVASVKMGNEFMGIYRHSQARQKSISTFADTTRSTDTLACDIFTVQFGDQVLGILDKWKVQLDGLTARNQALLSAIVKINRLRTRGEESPASLARMTSEFDINKNDFKAQVARHLESRYSVLDAVLVRVMECQMDFFAQAVEVTRVVEKNVQSYRKKFPRGTLPELLQGTAAAGGASQMRSPTTPVAPATKVDQSEEDESEESEEDEDDDEPVVARAATPPSAPQAKLPPLGHILKSAPSSTTNVSAPPKTGLPAAAAPEPIDFLSGFSSHATTMKMPTSSPVASQFEYLSSPAANTGFMSSSSPASNSAFMSSASPVNAPSAIDDLFSTSVDSTPIASFATDSAPDFMAFTSASDTGTEDTSSDDPNKRVQFLRNQIQAEEQIADAKERAKDTVSFPLDNWEFGHGQQRRNIRILLTTMHTVLPSNLKVPVIKMADVQSAPLVKKVVRKTMLFIHPDKVDKNNAELVVIAERVFNAIQVEFKNFEDNNST